MRNTVFIFIIALFVVSCGNRRNRPATENTELKAANVIDMNSSRVIEDRDTIELGTMKSGEVIEYQLGVRNTDSVAMVILDVTSSCGCTALDFDAAPVVPGGTAFVTIQYDSQGQSGSQVKLVRLFTSFSDQPHHILVHATVEE